MRAKLVAISLLSSVGFFNFHNLLSEPVQRATFLFLSFVCAVLALRNKNVSLFDYDFPRLPWFLFGSGLIISVFMTPFYHQQSLMATAIAQSTCIVAYLSFFVLLKLRPDPQKLLRLLVYVYIAAVVVFFVNVVTFPNNMFGAPIVSDLSRGFIRVRPLLLQLFVFMLFYGISRWQGNRQWKWLLFAAFTYLMIVLSLTRQTIAICALLAFFQIFHDYSWKKKLLIGVVSVLVGVSIVVNIPMYKMMMEVTEEQIDQNEDKEDVRIGAWRYYAYEANDEIATFLFGNGTPSLDKSVWGKQYGSMAEETDYHVGDVSWASCIFLYGIIATVALLCIVLMSIFKHKAPRQRYLTYFMIAEMLHGIAWGVFYYYYEVYIISIALYLIYCNCYDKEPEPVVKPSTPEKKARRRFVVD